MPIQVVLVPVETDQVMVVNGERILAVVIYLRLPDCTAVVVLVEPVRLNHAL